MGSDPLPLPPTSDLIEPSHPPILTPTFPPEVYAHIISYLRRPLPTPTGRNAHSSIRQNDLAVMMRTCKLFHDLTSIPLYNTVVADDLNLFSHNIHSPPSAADIRSKGELLCLTRRLFIERPNREPSYQQIMLKGFEAIAPSTMAVAMQCRREALSIAGAARSLQRVLRLETISSTVLLGGEDNVWKPVLSHPPLPDILMYTEGASQAITSLLTGTHITHYCSGASAGALSYVSPLFLPPSDQSRVRRHIAHVSLETDPQLIPVRPGGHTDCYVHVTPRDDPGVDAARNLIMKIVGLQLSLRQRAWEVTSHHVRAEVGDNRALSIDFHLPSCWTDHPRWPIAVELTFDIAIDAFTKQFGIPNVKDRFRLKRLDEAGPCPSCGWCPDDV